MIPIAKYMAFQCPECGEWNGKQNNDAEHVKNDFQRACYWRKMILKCKRCGRQAKFRYQRVNSTIKHRLFDHPGECSDFCREANFSKTHLNHNKWDSGSESR